MHCPVCNSNSTKVTDSRTADDGMSVRRRRECEQCAYRFSTREETELLDVVVMKRDGRRESYSRDKIRSALERSLHKIEYDQDAYMRMVQNIERDIQKCRKREIPSDCIGDIMMKRLKVFNTVAYIRFASVYRSFQDVSGFSKEIKKLTKQTKN